MNNVFAIGIPTLNRADLLNPVLKKYAADFPNTKIYVVDNGNQDIDFFNSAPSLGKITKIPMLDNIGVAASWNFICHQCFSSDKGLDSHATENILFLNDDIYLGKKEAHILGLIDKYKDDDFIIGEKGWCSFILPKKTYEKIGEFDEGFWPAYFEDGDYRYRMQLEGMSYITSPVLTPVYFRESMTRAKDPTLNQYFDANKKRYYEKWGGLPEQESFDYPFNNRT